MDWNIDEYSRLMHALQNIQDDQRPSPERNINECKVMNHKQCSGPPNTVLLTVSATDPSESRTSTVTVLPSSTSTTQLADVPCGIVTVSPCVVCLIPAVLVYDEVMER
jgi:hypothetical protein